MADDEAVRRYVKHGDVERAVKQGDKEQFSQGGANTHALVQKAMEAVASTKPPEQKNEQSAAQKP